MSGIDYYRVLGVSPSATNRAIREAYLGLVRRLHPDRVGPGGTALFQQITEAYEVLSNPLKRRAYDRNRGSVVTPGLSRTEGRGFRENVEPLVPEPTPAQPSRASSRFDIDDLHGSWRGVAAEPLRSFPTSEAEAVELQLVLIPQEAARGADLSLVDPEATECPWCGGAGGRLVPCLECGGDGLAVVERLLRIRLPRYVRDGSVLTYSAGLSGHAKTSIRLHIAVTGRW